MPCFRLLFAASLAASLAACGSEPPPLTSAPADSSPDGDLDAGGEPQQEEEEDLGPCEEGDEPRACTCEDDDGNESDGVRRCYEGTWLKCNCYGTGDGPGDTSGECKAGNYEGEFLGIHTSAYTFVGIPIPIYSVDVTGAPGLAFTLNKKVEAAGEFDIYTISDGVMNGTADGLFPVSGTLTGDLNCTSKTFTGTLKGGYCVGPCLGGVNFKGFEGPVSGYYDGKTFEFTSGTWDLVEDGMGMGVFGAYGGNGEWKAHWVSDAPDSSGATDADAGM